MIELKNASVRRDGRVLFSEVDLQIHPHFKVGLTGNNGAGKSSFFALLLGELLLDTGSLHIPKDWHIGQMAQEIASSQASALDFVLSGDRVWYALNQKLANPSREDDIAKLHSQFEDIDGYAVPARALTIMAGLGFAAGDEKRPVASFSGGWRMRLNLAKTLMGRHDLLLLDEPTNHLDLDAILWLEEHLCAYEGTLIVISHDEAFLDKVVGRILHIEAGKMTLYTGNYSTFLRTKSERLAQEQQAYQKQEATRSHLEAFVRRFKAKASKARQAQSRLKQLERMQILAPVMADSPFCFKFYPPSAKPSPLLVLDKASIGYGDAPILTGVSLQLTPDSRLGLLGVNGAGKSTLIKALVGELPLLGGTRRAADGLSVGYFHQHQMEALDGDATPLLLLRRLSSATSDAVFRAFLGGFDFGGDKMDTPVRLFSGGERARLTLALIVWQRPNLLVLDEPTNHLDLQMKAALTLALQDYEGAVVLVSHDRQLIGAVCDELWLVHGGKLSVFEEDIAHYGTWLKNNKPQTSKPDPKDSPSEQSDRHAPTPKISKDELRKQNAQRRSQSAPIRKKIAQEEARLQDLTTKLEGLQDKLGDGTLYDEANKTLLLALLDEQNTLKADMDATEERLLDAMAQLEAIQIQASEVP